MKTTEGDVDGPVDAKESPPSSVPLLTRTRLLISPHLPPPVLTLIRNIDDTPQLRQVIGPEPSLTLITIIVCLYVVGNLFKFLFTHRKAAAVEGLHDDDAPEGNVLSNLSGKKNANVEQEEQYGDSIIMFGPSGSGKTVIFHKLISIVNSEDEDSEMKHTVMSLKANASILKSDDGGDGVQVVDYPGHSSLSTQLPSLFNIKDQKDSKSIRGLFVLDSTRPLAEAAALFYNTILNNASLLEQWENEYEKKETKLQILVVCNKSDVATSKNWRRMKIQLRTELEKLRKISSSVESSSSLNGKVIDLDDLGKNGLPFVQLSFMSLSCCGPKQGIDALSSFVMGGELPTDNTSILKSRRK